MLKGGHKKFPLFIRGILKINSTPRHWEQNFGILKLGDLYNYGVFKFHFLMRGGGGLPPEMTHYGPAPVKIRSVLQG